MQKKLRFLTVNAIKKEVDKDRTVHWVNDSYTVIKDKHGKYQIKFGVHCIELTNEAGTLPDHIFNFYTYIS